MLTFDEAEHRYELDGKAVVSVTTVLKPLTDYGFIDPIVLELARQKGVAVHKTIELEVAGDLDEATLPEWLVPHLAAWRRFVADTGFEPVASEIRMAHPAMRYAGTADLIGRVGKETWLVDLKRSLYAGRVIGLQTAGYARLWASDPASNERKKINRRFALVLRDDTTYRLTEFKDPQDDSVFLAALAMWKWQAQGAKHGND